MVAGTPATDKETMPKRAWSRAFTPKNNRDVKLNISGVPPTLKAKFSAKCKREGRSQRNLILGWIRNWTAGRRPDDPGQELPSA
jgi:hypothetical protein